MVGGLFSVLWELAIDRTPHLMPLQKKEESMTIHKLKTVEPHFSNVLNGSKTFEIRLNDRDYKVGDDLILAKFPDVDKRSLIIRAKITHILKHEDFPQGIHHGYVVLSMSLHNIQSPIE